MAKIYDKPTSSQILDRMKMNPALTWLSDMIRVLSSNAIKIPKGYREKVLAVKNLLNNDISGMVNSTLDFCIDAALVNYQVKTKNKNLTKLLNGWLENINAELRGQIPVGIQPLAKEYFRERWKGSSLLLLRTFWEKKDGFIVPTIMYFVDGEDVIVDNKNESRSLNGKTYRLRLSDTKTKPLGVQKNEKLFLQRPYSPWGVEYTNPFLIQRGIYKNLKFLELLEEKGEFVVGKALEYLAILKKGSEGLTLSNNPDFIYSKSDLQKIKDDFSTFLANRNVTKGVSLYTTNFDTELEHSIPEYEKALKQELYLPIEKRIMAGLGLVDIVQGVSSTRRESILNPKPLFSEIKVAVGDFKTLLLDIMNTIAEENSISHRKYFGQDIKISSSVITEELSDKMITQFRSGYDRGFVSKRTLTEVLGINLDIELDRRKEEEQYEEEFYPPVTQNQEQTPNEIDSNPLKKEDVDDDKKGIEKKNFNKSDYEEAKIVHMKDGWHVLSEKNKNLGGPYKTKQEAVKRLKQVEFFKHKGEESFKLENIQGFPSGAKTIWMKAFNASYNEYGEDSAKKMALSSVNKIYKNIDGKWVRKTKAEIETSFAELDVNELIELKKLEILGKKNKLLDKLLETKE